MHDPPAFRQVPEDKGEPSVWLVDLAFELPTPNDDRRARAKRSDFQVRERERAHFLAIRIFFLVTIADCLPTARDSVFGNKDCRS